MDKPEPVFDTRTVRRHITSGLLTEADYQAYLDGLEDCADKAETVTTRFVHTANTDDDKA
ncbi:MAG: hypothetical protein GXP62_12230 [Oligoflexia bacterium]|nr:hypothetical protein [Oligoflexia bacterium]